jgi:hypothetical protein
MYRTHSAEFLLKPLDAFPERRHGDASVAAPPDVARFGRHPECFVSDGELAGYARYLCILNLICERWSHPSGEEPSAAPGTLRWSPQVNANQDKWPGQTTLETRLSEAFPEFLDGKELSLRGCLSHEARDGDGDAPRPREAGKRARKSARAQDVRELSGSLWKPPSYFNRNHPCYRVLEACVQQIRALSGCEPLTLQEILEKKIADDGKGVTRETVERFRGWLESDLELPVDDLSRLQPDLYLTAHGDARWIHLERVADLLLQEDAAPVMPLFCVSSAGVSNWSGLRAFCTRLCITLKDRQAKLPRGQRHALCYVSLRGLPSTEGSVRPTRRKVLDILLEFFELPRAASAGPEAELSDICRLNIALTTTRAIVIFDGLEIDEGELGALTGLIRNSDWCGLIRDLLQVDEETFLQGGGHFRSRILVLSNCAPRPLLPWMGVQSDIPSASSDRAVATTSACIDELKAADVLSELPASGNPVDVQRLVLERQAMDVALAELRKDCRRWWPSSYSRPSAEQWALPTLAAWFPFAAAEIARPPGQRGRAPRLLGSLAREADGVPREIDLTLAWCAYEMESEWPGNQGDLAQRQRPGKLMHILQAYLYGEDAGRRESGWPRQGTAVVLQLIALSVGGLRTRAIVRMLGMFAARVATDFGSLAKDVAHVRASLAAAGGDKALSDHFRVLLQWTEDDEQPALPEEVRWFELHAGAPGEERKASDDDKRFFDLRLQEMRDWLVSELLHSPEDRRRFHLLNEVLAEENLALATSQIRRLPPGAMSDVQALRHFIRVAFNGLLSLDPERLEQSPPDDPAGAGAARLPRQGALPDDHYRRWIFLYEFIFRKCIENAPDWTLSRGMAMHEVRAALLNMFVDPARAVAVMAQRYDMSRESRAVPATVPRDKLLQQHMRGAPGADLVEALLRSSLGGHQRWELARGAPKLAKHLLGAGPREPGQGADHEQSQWWFEFHKIGVDAALRHEKTEKTLVETGELLELAGVVGADADLAACAARLRESGWDRMSVEGDELHAFSLRLMEDAPAGGRVERMHDALARHGEALARHADVQDDGPSALALFAQAYCAFFVSDRLRAHAAGDPLSVDWPLMSARVMRASIRVALKLAKVVAKFARAAHRADDLPAARTLLANALSYYAYVRSRVGVYTRHTYRFPSERLHGVLLLVAAARVRTFLATVQLEIQPTRPDGKPFERPSAFIQMACEYLRTAHEQLVQHDFNDSLIRRFLLERIKTRSLIANWPDGGGRPQAAGNAALVRRDWHVLRRLSTGNTYWDALVSRVAKHGQGPGGA